MPTPLMRQVLVTALPIVLLASCTEAEKGEPVANTNTDKPAAAASKPSTVKAENNYSFEMLEGGVKSLSDYKGKPVVVNFFATWCGPCRAELPHFEEAYAAHKGKIEMVVISVDRQDVGQFVVQNGYTMPFAFDQGGAQMLGVRAIPHTFFYDKDGQLQDDVVGAMDKAQLESKIASLL